jgi:GxxExxY protein
LEGYYRADLIAFDCVLVEVKVVAALLPVHQAQALSYMRLASLPVGLLLDFNVPRLVEGVRRLILPAPTEVRRSSPDT